MSIWVTFALLEEKKTEAVFTIFTTVIPAESALFWETTAVFSALWINSIVNFPPNEGCLHALIDFVPMPWATAVQSFYRKGVVEVSDMSSIWPGESFYGWWWWLSQRENDLISTGEFMGIFSWQRGMRSHFNMWIEQICCWHWENGGGAPQRSFGNTAFKNSNNVWQLWIFLWWINFIW